MWSFPGIRREEKQSLGIAVVCCRHRLGANIIEVEEKHPEGQKGATAVVL